MGKSSTNVPCESVFSTRSSAFLQRVPKEATFQGVPTRAHGIHSHLPSDSSRKIFTKRNGPVTGLVDELMFDVLYPMHPNASHCKTIHHSCAACHVSPIFADVFRVSRNHEKSKERWKRNVKPPTGVWRYDAGLLGATTSTKKWGGCRSCSRRCSVLTHTHVGVSINRDTPIAGRFIVENTI